MRTLEAALAERMKNPEFRAEYEALEPEFAIVQAIIDARTKGITQKQLSEKTGINQDDINKIETGETSPSLNTLKSLAKGMNMKLRLEFLPVDEQQMSYEL